MSQTNITSSTLLLQSKRTSKLLATINLKVHHTAAITTVSRFFSDKHSGAATEVTDSSADSPARRQRSLLQRLHIHTSVKRGKSPTPIRPPTAPAAVSGGSPSITAVRHSPSRSDATTIEEITRIMPQSLLLSTPPQAGTSAKRQRSADSRDPHPRPNSAGETGSSRMSRTTSSTQLKSNVRIPPYLEKSRNGKYARSSCHGD